MPAELTHKDLARRLGVSVTTIKSYRVKFPGAIPPVGRGKPLRFAPGALAACRAIQQGFQRGLSIDDIKSVLKKEFPGIDISENLSIRDDMRPPAGQGQGHPRRDVPGTHAEPDEAGQDAGREAAAILRQFQAEAQQDTARRLERLETMLAELVALGSRTHSLHVELLAKLDALAGLPGPGPGGLRTADIPSRAPGGVPPSAFLALPVVLQSGRGEFLGITGKAGAPFSLGEFEAHLLRRAGRMDVSGGMHAVWSPQGEDWVLALRGGERRAGAAGPSQAPAMDAGHEHYFRRATTPRNNLVAVFHRLRINGKDVSEAFLRAFFKQIKDSLE